MKIPIVHSLLQLLFFIALLVEQSFNKSIDSFLIVLLIAFIINLFVIIGPKSLKNKVLPPELKRWQYIWFIFFNLFMIAVIIYKLNMN